MVVLQFCPKALLVLAVRHLHAMWPAKRLQVLSHPRLRVNDKGRALYAHTLPWSSHDATHASTARSMEDAWLSVISMPGPPLRSNVWSAAITAKLTTLKFSYFA
jgi:hypothetical protein